MTEDQARDFCRKHSKSITNAVLASSGNQAAIGLLLAETTQSLALAVAVASGGNPEILEGMVDAACEQLRPAARQLAATLKMAATPN